LNEVWLYEVKRSLVVKSKETLSSDMARGNEVMTSVSLITITDGKNTPDQGFSPNLQTGGQAWSKTSITTTNVR
jgi:hypothetical protein